MKTPLSLPKFITLIFGLSLASLSAYISFLVQPGVEHNSYPVAFIVESSEQRFDDEEDWHSSRLHQHRPIGWITLNSPPVSQRHIELQQRSQPVTHLIQKNERRTLVSLWFLVAMTAIALPLSLYMLFEVNHRLGGWKEANTQYRSIAEPH